MKTQLILAPIVVASVLFSVTPAAHAFYLSTQANRDVHPSPILSPSGLVAVSGTATALNDGYADRYPGKVKCTSHAGYCFFGPVASARFGGTRYVMYMGCNTYGAHMCRSDNSISGVIVNNTMTWDQAISAWRARYGQTLSNYHAFSYNSNTPGLCTSWATYGDYPGFWYLLPGADSCGVMPPLPNQCTVSGATVALNHGTLNAGDISGKKVEVTRQVNCLRSASIRYTVSTGNPVDLGNGINSSITVNGVPAGQTINLPAGNSSWVIASTLTDKGATPGTFSKAVVLIQTFM